MADQKRWFKFWCSAPADDDLQALPPAVRWAWAAFGAYTKEHGTRGKIKVRDSNIVLASQMGVTVDALFDTIKLLPHMTFEEGKNRHDELTVTWHNWVKYQEDTTQAARQQTSRTKRRGEERRIRGEKEEKTPDPLPGWLDPVIWEAFKSYRKKMRKPLEEEATIKKLAKYHDEGQDPNEILEQTMVQGWQGLFPVKRQDREETPEEQLERMRKEGKL